MNENEILELLRKDPALKADAGLWPGIREKAGERFGEKPSSRRYRPARVLRLGLTASLVLVFVAAAITLPKILEKLNPAADVRTDSSLSSGNSVVSHAPSAVESAVSSAAKMAASSVPSPTAKSVFGPKSTSKSASAGVEKAYGPPSYQNQNQASQSKEKKEAKISINNKSIAVPKPASNAKSQINMDNGAIMAPTGSPRFQYVLYNREIYKLDMSSLSETASNDLGFSDGMDICAIQGINPDDAVAAGDDTNLYRYDSFMGDTFKLSGVNYRIIGHAGNDIHTVKTIGEINGLTLYSLKTFDPAQEIAIRFTKTEFAYAYAEQ